jgi:hypothetical protein
MFAGMTGRDAEDVLGPNAQQNGRMTWLPNATVERLPELDGFRRTATAVMHGDRIVAHLVCEVEPYYTVSGGRLWRRRWAGKEIVHGYESHGDSHNDWVSDPAHPISAIFLRDLLNGWYRERDYDESDSADQEPPVVNEYRVHWLAEPERSRVLRENGF